MQANRPGQQEKKAMTIPDPLRAGFERFRVSQFESQRRVWRELAKGQKPHALVIGCADSRVDPAAIFDAGPGELFIVRNVANLVPPYEPDSGHHGVSAALEFAVKTLGIEHVVVLGHKDCGGVHAAVTGAAEGTEFVHRWISPLQSALSESRHHCGYDAPTETLCNDLELRSVQHSLDRLLKFPFVAKAVEAGTLALHGARFGIADGQLEWLERNEGFQPVSI
jgi:carbonic anhydrase